MSALKIGTETGSLTNYLMSGTDGQPVPEIGMGITILGWTDRHAGTITEVSKSGKTLKYRMDKAKRTDDNGMSDCQEYEFEFDPEAPEVTARLTKRGWKTKHGTRITLGFRSAYYDYSF